MHIDEQTRSDLRGRFIALADNHAPIGLRLIAQHPESVARGVPDAMGFPVHQSNGGLTANTANLDSGTPAAVWAAVDPNGVHMRLNVYGDPAAVERFATLAGCASKLLPPDPHGLYILPGVPAGAMRWSLELFDAVGVPWFIWRQQKNGRLFTFFQRDALQHFAARLPDGWADNPPQAATASIGLQWRGTCYYVGEHPADTDAATASAHLIAALGESSEGGERPAKCDAPTIGNSGTQWRDAMKRAEEHVKAHGGVFPSVRRLADIVGCSRATINKAVENSTYLKARQAEARSRQSGRTVALSDAAIDEASKKKHDRDELAVLLAEQADDLTRDERQAQAAAKKRRS